VRPGGQGEPVCHVTTVHGPFDDRIFHKECLSLVRAGYEVHLVAVHDRDEVVDGVHIHALPTPPGRLARITRWPLLAYRKVLSIHPRICHFHDPELLMVGMALRLRGCRVVFDVHENVAEQIREGKDYMPRALRLLLSLSYRAVELICTSGMTTVHVVDSIAASYRHPRVVLRNLPKLEVAPSGSARPLKSRPRLIHTAGLISRERGAMTMISVAADLARRGMDFELRLVGRIHEALHREMIAAIQRAGLADRVTLVGWVSFERSQEELAEGDIGLALSQKVANVHRSLPIKLMEYMRFGLPVVATDVECWKPYVLGIGSGLLVDVNRPEQIADSIQWLLRHPEESRQMGLRGRRAVETHLCWDREQQKLLDLYDRLVRPNQTCH